MLKHIFIGSFFLCNLSYAQENKTNGWIGILGGDFKIEDNFYYHKDSKKINSLNDIPKEVDESLILPTFNIKYGDYFIKTEIKDEFLVKGGYSWEKDNSIYLTNLGAGIIQTFENNFFYTFDYKKIKMYENPYLTGIDRKDIDSDQIDFKLGFMELYDFVDITYSFQNIDIDDKVNNDAQQSGYTHQLEVFPYFLQFNENSYGGVGFIGGIGKYDGKSNDYEKYGLIYGMEYNYNKHKVEFTSSYVWYKFDNVNSYFNKTRDEKEFEFILTYTKEKLFDYEKCFMNIIFLKNKIDSNINFFNKEEEIIGINLGYKF